MRMIFFALWGLSLLLMLAAAAQLWRAFVRKKEEVTRALAKSLGLLFVSIFCVRLAVGLYLADGALVEEPNGLNLFETALDSAVHSLQTFSMDEGYTDYLFAGRFGRGGDAGRHVHFAAEPAGPHCGRRHFAGSVEQPVPMDSVLFAGRPAQVCLFGAE